MWSGVSEVSSTRIPLSSVISLLVRQFACIFFYSSHIGNVFVLVFEYDFIGKSFSRGAFKSLHILRELQDYILYER